MHLHSIHIYFLKYFQENMKLSKNNNLNNRIGFYFIKLFLRNEWKEYIIDDRIPVFRSDKMPIFSNA